MNAKQTKRVGNVVTFRDRFGRDHSGIVVREVYFPWCLGASSVDVLADDGNLYGLPMFDACYRVVEERGDMGAARAFYRAHLSQYPVWAERFASMGDAACGF